MLIAEVVVLLSFDYSSVVAALDDRIQFLTKKYPLVSEESIKFLSGCDPTGGKYLEYLVSQRANGILLDEDSRAVCWTVKHALEFFMMMNQSKKLNEHLKEILSLSKFPNNIYQINIKDLYFLAMGNYDSAEQEIKRFKGTKKHSKILYQDDMYKILAFFVDPLGNYDELIDEVCAYGKGKWCTQHRVDAEKYLDSGGLYIVFRNGKSLLQTDGKEEYKDVVNHNFNFFGYSDLAVILMKTGLIKLVKGTDYNKKSNLETLEELHYYHDLEYKSGPVYEYVKKNDLI
jgi:hypothetical protein